MFHLLMDIRILNNIDDKSVVTFEYNYSTRTITRILNSNRTIYTHYNSQVTTSLCHNSIFYHYTRAHNNNPHLGFPCDKMIS